MKYNAVILLLIISFAPVFLFGNTQFKQNVSENVTLSIDYSILKRNKARYVSGDEEFRRMVSGVVSLATQAMKEPVGSVVEKGEIVGISDPHNFVSMGPYWWPDPSKKDGLPYIRKDGLTNPEVSKVKDKSYLNQLSEAINLLGLAYFFTEDEKFAADAVTRLHSWFIDEKTKMNPNLNHGQYIPGRNNGRAEGIIDTRVLIPILDGIQLIKTSPSFTADINDGINHWFSEFLNWLQNSPIGKRGATLENNIGTAYQLQIVGISIFLGRPEIARQNFKSRIPTLLDKQFNTDGLQVFEVERTNSWNYSLLNLSYWFSIAQMLELAGVDLWNYKTPSGRSLQSCFEWMMSYALGNNKWQYTQYRDVDYNGSFSRLFQDANSKFKRNYILFKIPKKYESYQAVEKISNKPLDAILR